MKIIRNKYLTRIIGSDTELKLRTDKYDDIVGITDGILPATKFSAKELIKFDEEGVVILNSNKLTISELCEFADMNINLYISSIYNASSRFELENIIIDRTIMKINQLLGRFINDNVIDFRFKISRRRDINITPKGIIRDIPTTDDVTELTSSKSTSINLESILDKDNINIICDKLRKIYTKAINNTIFYDKNGHVYSFQMPTNEELQKLIINHLVFFKLNKSMPTNGSYNINIYKEIFLKLDTWKRYKSGILMLIKDGQEVLVDISTLITEQVYLQMKKYGKSILDIKNFSQIPY